jgi:hypothetical protein
MSRLSLLCLAHQPIGRLPTNSGPPINGPSSLPSLTPMATHQSAQSSLAAISRRRLSGPSFPHLTGTASHFTLASTATAAPSLDQPRRAAMLSAHRTRQATNSPFPTAPSAPAYLNPNTLSIALPDDAIFFFLVSRCLPLFSPSRHCR